MKKYTIVIEEILDKDFEVYAECPNEALEKAIQKYKRGVFVLEPGNLSYKQISVINSMDEFTGWMEF